MFKSIFEDLKQQINFGNNITRLIIVNIVVFISLYIAFAIVSMSTGPNYLEVQNTIIEWLSLPSKPIEILKKPWTILTHMFLHRTLWHLVFNMLMLYWFGRIFGDLMGDRRVVPLYLLAGLAGAVFYVIGVNLIGGGGIAYGASAAMLGFVIAAAYVAPDHTIHLIIIGPVRLKYIALFSIVIDLIGIANLDNTGGHFGHIGGMVMGWFFINLINNGNDPSPWFNKTYDSAVSLFDKKESKKNRSPLSVRHKASVGSKVNPKSGEKQHMQGPSKDQTKLDSILDKISKDGIGSLTKEEKKFLDNASKND